jgi:hypothetical protein
MVTVSNLFITITIINIIILLILFLMCEPSHVTSISVSIYKCYIGAYMLNNQRMVINVVQESTFYSLFLMVLLFYHLLKQLIHLDLFSVRTKVQIYIIFSVAT